MKRLIGSVALLLAMTTATQAHFVFMVPLQGSGGRGVTVIFSDSLEMDKADYLKKLAPMKFSAISIKGKLQDLDTSKIKPSKADNGKGSIRLNLVELNANTSSGVIGTCAYGVIAKGDKPFMLYYHARAAFNREGRTQEVPAKVQPLQLLVTAVKKGEATVKVIWQGKALKGAEVAVVGVKSETPIKTDARGEATVKLPDAKKVGIRARHVEEKAGDHDGKKYSSTRHYATTVFNP